MSAESFAAALQKFYCWENFLYSINTKENASISPVQINASYQTLLRIEQHEMMMHIRYIKRIGFEMNK